MRISDWSSDVCSSDLLLVRFLVHENQHVAFGVKILKILGVETNAFNGFSGPEPYIVLAPIDQVFQFDLHISATLSRMSVLNFQGATKAAFIFNIVARTNVHATDLHRAYCLFTDVNDPWPAPLTPLGILRKPRRSRD